MGFIKRFLGLEQEPGEPRKISDRIFDEVISESELPCMVYFYHLWCSSCQVMGGLLNEIGPEYVDRASFYKMDIMKDPHTAAKFNIKSVPRVICFKGGEAADSLERLIPLDELRDWVESQVK
ncbi:MAG: thioredoxin domain-containing protein [Candidatus Krumholzibacteriales bacterium]